MNKKTIYFFSGLGADYRAFQNIQVPPNCQAVFVEWLAPLPNEKMEQYAQRISQVITAPQPIIVGLSFGGMMAVEVAKWVATEQVILISSAKTYDEIPFYYRWAACLQLHHLVPVQLLKWHNTLTNWFFGASQAPHQQLLKTILQDTPEKFLFWAIDCILTWKNTVVPLNCVHIHGTNDKILPLFFIKNSKTIVKGGHLMVLDKAVEVNQILYLNL
jgi:pimeloyl-ACP methyl ester carboxylesterase